ncbi:MAG: hypothetical protein QM778_12495 [Myxococcales bacterium]
MTRSFVSMALLLGATSACAHGHPVKRHTVSAVTNEEVTHNPEEPGKTKMTYSKVDDQAALNHDEEHEELDAMYGTLGHGHAPQPALSAAPESEAPNSETRPQR